MTKAEYYQQNKERLKAQAKARYWANRDAILAQERARRLADPEAHRQRRERDYAKFGDRRREAARDYARRNPGRRFGLTAEQYQGMLEAQGGVCAICKRKDPKKRLSVDHCHKSGKIRALLCSTCNLVLGKFLDDPNLFTAAAEYLRSH